MRSLLFALLLLCALWSSTIQSQEPASAIRLCGREFLRAIIYTCGGSRWRRISSEVTEEGYGDQNGLETLRVNPEMERVRRDLNAMLSIVCCEVGCRRSDLFLVCRGG